MPVPDPLDNIMNMLKSKGTVDPNQAAARSARSKVQRTVAGANPPATKKPPHQGVKPSVPPDVMTGQAGVPQGISADFQEQPNMMSVVVDAMNEAIIGLKTEIHRAKDPETRRTLEKQIKGIRQQVIDMGGEPIYADESIEDGLKKLRGYGAVGTPTPSWVTNTFGDSQGSSGPALQANVSTQNAPTSQQQQDAWNILGPKQTTITSNVVGGGAGITAPQVEVPAIPPPMTADSGPDFFGQFVADPKRDGAVDELGELIDRVTGRESTPLPEMKVNDEMINTLLTQYGVNPKTPEEIAESAQAIVERQKVAKEQVIQREIERFEREHDQEFAKAQKQVATWAASQSADRREEMAARGMFYSSVMANSLEEIDTKSLDIIGEISQEAANRVADLHGELQDVAQWAILEEEFVKRELETQDDALRQSLYKMHVEVAMWGDQMALDRWYKQNSIDLQSDQMSLQGIQLKMAYADQQGQNLAAAFMADHPLAQNTLVGMGITQEAFGQMPLEQQAALVRNVVGFNEVEQQMRANELNMRAVVANIALQNAKMQLDAMIASAEISSRMAIASMQVGAQLAMHASSMDLAWAELGLNQDKFNWAKQMDLMGSSGSSGSAVATGVDWGLYEQGVGVWRDNPSHLSAYLNQEGMNDATKEALINVVKQGFVDNPFMSKTTSSKSTGSSVLDTVLYPVKSNFKLEDLIKLPPSGSKHPYQGIL